nr:putative ribonuclease H-like domain-containing protein [Tanacetum cinerariifolium]
DKLLQFKLLNVWTLVNLPKDKWAIGTKWVFRNKKDKRGIVIKNKARLVAQGHTQEEGIDYDEVFAPVARIEAIRLFLAYASFKDILVYQMNVKSDFLYEKIEEEVYVYQPPGFEDLIFLDKVYKVEKALHGLHQAPKAWYETLSIYLMNNGFHKGQIDKTLFIKRHKNDILPVQVYVDEIIFGSTKKESTSTPRKPNKALINDAEAEDVDVHLYRSMIGSLMYLTASRPDITFAVYACARFQVTPKTSHILAVKRIFRYLKEYVADDSCCEQTAAKVKKVNGQEHIQALADKQKVIIMEESIRHDLKFDVAKVFLDKQVEEMAKHKEIYVISSHTKKVFPNMRRQGQGFSGNVTPLFETMMVNAQEEVCEGLGLHTDSHHTPSDTHPSSSKHQKKITPKRKQRQATEVHSPSSEILVEESLPTPSNDTLPSGEDSIQLNELMIFYINLQQQGRMHDVDMFKVDDLEVTAASVEDSAAPTTATTVDDKGKPKMIKPKKPLKKKDQITLDEEMARTIEVKMKAKIEEEERIVKEKDEANRAMIEECDDVQATIDAVRQLAEQIQAQEREHLSIKERSKLLVELNESRRKYFAAKKAEEIRNKPPTKAQQ